MLFDCGVSAQIVLSNHASTAQSFVIDGVQHYMPSTDILVLPCTGQVDVTPWGNIAVQMIASPLNTVFGALDLINQFIVADNVYFFLGITAGLVFVAGLRSKI